MDAITNLWLDEIVDLVVENEQESKIDDFYRIQVRELLEDQLMDQIEITFFQNLTEEQAQHFDSFLENRFDADGDADIRVLILDFAAFYPTLLEAMHVDILIFFEEFVERFED